jgi:hypothetical protein
MVEHTPDEENIDWTKIEPGVNFLKSPKGTCAHGPPHLGFRSVMWAVYPSWSGCGCGLGSWVSKWYWLALPKLMETRSLGQVSSCELLSERMRQKRVCL